jgi:hypothetical protein
MHKSVITVGYSEASKHQSLLPAVNSIVPGLMFPDKAVFILSEMACNEDQGCRLIPTTAQLITSI